MDFTGVAASVGKTEDDKIAASLSRLPYLKAAILRNVSLLTPRETYARQLTGGGEIVFLSRYPRRLLKGVTRNQSRGVSLNAFIRIYAGIFLSLSLSFYSTRPGLLRSHTAPRVSTNYHGRFMRTLMLVKNDSLGETRRAVAGCFNILEKAPTLAIRQKRSFHSARSHEWYLFSNSRRSPHAFATFTEHRKLRKLRTQRSTIMVDR